MAAIPDHYGILGVRQDSDTDTIKAAHRALAARFHPDVNNSPDATRHMQEINTARDVLLNPLSRVYYDLDLVQHGVKSTQATKASAKASSTGMTPDPSEERSRAKHNYVLRHGIFAGMTLEEVDLRYPPYLQSYLNVKMGDAAERNAIREYLNHSRDEWETEKSGESDTGKNADASHNDDGQKGEQLRPNSGYSLRHGSYTGRTLQWVYANHPSYLSYYLTARMGDMQERNHIRSFLFIPRAQWEKDPPPPRPSASRRTAEESRSRPSSQRPRPRASNPADFTMKYGVFAGRRIADVHEISPDYLRSYLERRQGTTDERAAIGRFLNVDPAQVRNEYLSRIAVPIRQGDYRHHMRPLDEPTHTPWKGILISLALFLFFGFAISVTRSDTPIATPTTARQAATSGQVLPTYALPNRVSTISAPPVPNVPLYNPSTVDPRILLPSSVDPRFLTPFPTINPSSLRPPSPYQPAYGSWIAYKPSIAIRFYAMPNWVEHEEFSSAERLSLGSPSSDYSFEAVDIYRFRGVGNSADSRAWQAEYDSYTRRTGLYNPSMTSAPRLQKAAQYGGNIGQFHYYQASNDLQIDVTMWVGQVDGDRVVMIFRCEPARDVELDKGVAQVLATIDFNAR